MNDNPEPKGEFVSPDSSTAHSRAVSVDDTGVRRKLADGSEERVDWDDLASTLR